MAALVEEAHASREQPAPEGDRNPDNIVRIDEGGRCCIHVELGKDAAENAHLPSVAAIALSDHTEVLAKPDRPHVEIALLRRTNLGRLQGREKLRLLRIGPERPKDIVFRKEFPPEEPPLAEDFSPIPS